jgi:gluconokinase
VSRVGTEAVVVMGVSGVGKSTVGELLATRLSYRFLDADDLHPHRNVEKMTSGQPLTDEDRVGWLETTGRAIALGEVVVACSALKRTYRDRLRRHAPGLQLVHLRGDVPTLAARLEQRAGHFMPASLLASQLADLQLPTPDEDAIDVSARGTPLDVAEQAYQCLRPGTSESVGKPAAYRAV